MKTNMLSLARKHFDRPYLDRKIVRHNCRAWVRSIRHLGDQWLLATQVERKS
jgi:hypothetical protein